MSALSLTRSAFVAALMGFSLFAAAGPAHAARNQEAEAYVQTNASAALQALRSASRSERISTFTSLMRRFSDMPRIASFVLGRYGMQLRSDPALRSEWNSAFQSYAIASYETQLTRYSANEIQVVGSIERVPGRDVIVRSQIEQGSGQRPSIVEWRLLKTSAGWKVVDVSLVIDGSQIWLAQQQQSEFLAALDRLNGDIRALIAELEQRTAQMRS